MPSMIVLSPYADSIAQHLAHQASQELRDTIQLWTTPDAFDAYPVAYDETSLQEWFKRAATLTFHVARLAQHEQRRAA